ncbi:MAG: sugar kinase [Proteobacteria bacterium]|nr:sugar kinase [Pseudomonadota bacterium]
MRIVALGELLLRLKSPGALRLMQGPVLEADFGGSEFNVLALLSRLGLVTDYVTTLPENELGGAALRQVVAHGVGAGHIRRAPGRLGLYFLESGSGLRRPKVLYDRADSALARTPADSFNWPEILRGAGCLHLSGITPAVSAQAATMACHAARAARTAGVRVSMDINMRATLWAQSGRDASAALAPLIAEAAVLFATPADAPVCLPPSARAEADSTPGLAAALFAHYPKLEVLVSGSKRGTSAADFNLLATAQHRGSAAVSAREIEIRSAAENIGAGDALVGGCLYGLLQGWPTPRWLQFGLAAQALKHTIPGDIALVSREEIEAVLEGASPLRVQR